MPLVLKKLRPEFLSQPSIVAKFSEQALQSKFLNHENICSILDVVSSGADPGYVCERLDGKTLRQLISAICEAGNALPVWFAIHVARCICHALECAHKNTDHFGKISPIFHQNLCPENVFLTYQGQIKVADFGLSHTVLQQDFAPANNAPVPHTRMPGVPVLAPTPQECERADLDGVGRTLYELLTGVNPETPTTSLVDFVPPSQHAPWINAEVDQILRRILSPSYPARVKNAVELRMLLEEYLTQRRHDVSSTHIAGLVTVLFSSESRDALPPATKRFNENAVQMAHLRSRRTSPPDVGFRAGFENSAPTRPGLSMPAPAEQIARQTVPSPSASKDVPAIVNPRDKQDSCPDIDQLDENTDNKPNPFHHDWDLALKRAREQTQSTARNSGTYSTPTPKAAPPPPPIDPVEQAVIEFERGLELRTRGDLEAALVAWEKALELDPQHRVCRANLNLLKKKLNLT
jgi:serine/threonine-protein kinase